LLIALLRLVTYFVSIYGIWHCVNSNQGILGRNGAPAAIIHAEIRDSTACCAGWDLAPVRPAATGAIEHHFPLRRPIG
jgi:hypothetical protein